MIWCTTAVVIISWRLQVSSLSGSPRNALTSCFESSTDLEVCIDKLLEKMHGDPEVAVLTQVSSLNAKTEIEEFVPGQIRLFKTIWRFVETAVEQKTSNASRYKYIQDLVGIYVENGRGSVLDLIHEMLAFETKWKPYKASDGMYTREHGPRMQALRAKWEDLADQHGHGNCIICESFVDPNQGYELEQLRRQFEIIIATGYDQVLVKELEGYERGLQSSQIGLGTFVTEWYKENGLKVDLYADPPQSGYQHFLQNLRFIPESGGNEYFPVYSRVGVGGERKWCWVLLDDSIQNPSLSARLEEKFGWVARWKEGLKDMENKCHIAGYVPVDAFEPNDSEHRAALSEWLEAHPKLANEFSGEINRLAQKHGISEDDDMPADTASYLYREYKKWLVQGIRDHIDRFLEKIVFEYDNNAVLAMDLDKVDFPFRHRHGEFRQVMKAAEKLSQRHRIMRENDYMEQSYNCHENHPEILAGIEQYTKYLSYALSWVQEDERFLNCRFELHNLRSELTERFVQCTAYQHESRSKFIKQERDKEADIDKLTFDEQLGELHHSLTTTLAFLHKDVYGYQFIFDNVGQVMESINQQVRPRSTRVGCRR